VNHFLSLKDETIAIRCDDVLKVKSGYSFKLCLTQTYIINLFTVGGYRSGPTYNPHQNEEENLFFLFLFFIVDFVKENKINDLIVLC